MDKNLSQSITPIIVIELFLLNIKELPASNNSSHFKLSTLRKLWAYDFSGTSLGSTSGNTS